MVIQRTAPRLAATLAGIALLAGCGPPPEQPFRESVSMFAVGAQASSVGLPNSTDYSEIQALGPPNISICGDDVNAWSPYLAEPVPGVVNTPDGPDTIDDWLVVTFPEYTYVHQVKIYESFNPGAVVAVDLEASDDSVPPLTIFEDYTGNGPAACPSAFVITIDQGTTPDMYDRVAIYLDTNLVGDTNGVNGPDDDYNAIDAVEMIGDRIVYPD